MKFWVFCYCSSNKTVTVQLFKCIFPFSGMNFHYYLEKLSFRCHFAEFWANLPLIQKYQFNDHFVRFYYFWLRYHILIFSNTCNYQSWFRVNQHWNSARCSLLKTQFYELRNSTQQRWFRADFVRNSAEFFSSEQRWFQESQNWPALFQSWSALLFFMFSESTVKNVKSLKQRFSRILIISRTSTRVSWCIERSANWTASQYQQPVP